MTLSWMLFVVSSSNCKLDNNKLGNNKLGNNNMDNNNKLVDNNNMEREIWIIVLVFEEM